MDDTIRELIAAASGGRVAHTPFLDPVAADRISAALRQAGIEHHRSGGYPGARRTVITSFPSHVPEATTPLSAVYFAGISDAEGLLAALTGAGVAGGHLGDSVRHHDGLSLICLAPPDRAILDLSAVAGRPVEPQEVDVDRVAAGALKRFDTVVPSLRVDALGAKAFRVSRSFFRRGVDAGRVTVNGAVAAKSAQVALGDEVYADGLGRFRLVEIGGETRRGNLRVRLEVEQARA